MPIVPNAAKLLLAKLIGGKEVVPEILQHPLPKKEMNKLKIVAGVRGVAASCTSDEIHLSSSDATSVSSSSSSSLQERHPVAGVTRLFVSSRFKGELAAPPSGLTGRPRPLRRRCHDSLLTRRLGNVAVDEDEILHGRTALLPKTQPGKIVQGHLTANNTVIKPADIWTDIQRKVEGRTHREHLNAADNTRH